MYTLFVDMKATYDEVERQEFLTMVENREMLCQIVEEVENIYKAAECIVNGKERNVP